MYSANHCPKRTEQYRLGCNNSARNTALGIRPFHRVAARNGVARSLFARKGVAPLEYLMIIPVIASIIALLAFVARVHTKSLETGQDAELASVQKSVEMISAAQLENSISASGLASSDLKQLVKGFRPSHSPEKGLVISVSSGSLDPADTKVVGDIGPIEDGHLQFGHAWDQKYFEFPQSESAQPQLTMPKAIRGIAPSITNFREFRSLLEFRPSISAPFPF